MKYQVKLSWKYMDFDDMHDVIFKSWEDYVLIVELLFEIMFKHYSNEKRIT